MDKWTCSHMSSLQELKGKILLKAKKIGGLEEYLDETCTDEVSDEEEMANCDAEMASTEDSPEKVDGCSNYFLSVFP